MGNRENLEFPWSLEDTIENIERIRNMLLKRVRVINLYGKTGCDVREINLDFGRAIKALKKESANEWIPVSERMPETQGYYLVTTLRSPRIEMAWYLSGDWFWNNSDTKMGEVIAWMPLPETYKTETTPDLPSPAAEHYMHRFTEVKIDGESC